MPEKPVFKRQKSVGLLNSLDFDAIQIPDNIVVWFLINGLKTVFGTWLKDLSNSEHENILNLDEFGIWA